MERELTPLLSALPLCGIDAEAAVTATARQ